MNDETVAGRPRRARGGCLLRLAIGVVAATLLIIVIGLIFDQDADAPGGGDGGTYDAGAASRYGQPSVNYIDFERIYIVRLADGRFIALYDRSARQQELGGDCRVAYDESAGASIVEQLSGFTGAFVEDCEGARTVWRADGTFTAGAGYGDLDRFDTHVDGSGNLIVETDRRTCTRSAGVPGIPPYRQQTCGAPD